MRNTPALTAFVTGQTLELRFLLGRPTSATFEVFRAYADDTGTPEFSGTATLDSVNTTTSAAAGPSETDPQNISLTSVSGIVGTRKYLLSKVGLKEWVTPAEIGSNYVRHRHVLQNDYASGALFQSTTLTAAVDATFIADQSKISDLDDTHPDYRVVWTVVYAGATYTIYSFFDVVTSPTDYSVDIDDVNARAPGLVDSLPVEYRAEEGAPLLLAAWQQVRAHIVAVGLDPNAVQNNEAIDELVVLRSLRTLAEGGWHPAVFDATEYVTLTTANYNRYFEQHFAASLRVKVAAGLGASTSLPASKPYWGK